MASAVSEKRKKNTRFRDGVREFKPLAQFNFFLVEIIQVFFKMFRFAILVSLF